MGLGGSSFGALAGATFPRGGGGGAKKKKDKKKKEGGTPGSPNNGLGEFGL